MWDDSVDARSYYHDMTQEQMKKLLNGSFDTGWNAEKTEEEILRERHPGLQEQWEKYQTMLRLVK